MILGAKLRLTPGTVGASGEKMDDLMARRRASQPLEYPSAGSTFKRPGDTLPAPSSTKRVSRG